MYGKGALTLSQMARAYSATGSHRSARTWDADNGSSFRLPFMSLRRHAWLWAVVVASLFAGAAAQAEEPRRYWFFANLGLMDEAVPGSDGVRFRVLVRHSAVSSWEPLLDQVVDAPGWRPVAVELTPWAGVPLDFRLVVGPGSRGDATKDFAVWGEARISSMPASWEVAEGVFPDEQVWLDLVDRSYEATTGVEDHEERLNPRTRQGGGAVFDSRRNTQGRTRATFKDIDGVERPGIYHHPAWIGGGRRSWGQFSIMLPRSGAGPHAWVEEVEPGSPSDPLIIRIKSRASAAGSVPLALQVDGRSVWSETVQVPPGDGGQEIGVEVDGLRPGLHSYKAKSDGILVGEGDFRVVFPLVEAADVEDVPLPDHGGVFFSFLGGIEDGAFPCSDGVEFQVGIRAVGQPRSREQLVHRQMVHKPGWHASLVDLNAWQGQDVVMTLRLDPGSDRDPNCDWGVWAEPRIVMVSESSGALSDGEGPALETVLDLMDVGVSGSGVGDVEVSLTSPSRNSRGAVVAPNWSSEGRSMDVLHESAGIRRRGIFHHPAYVYRGEASWVDYRASLPVVDPILVRLTGPDGDVYDDQRVPLDPMILSRADRGASRIEVAVTEDRTGEVVFSVDRVVEIVEGRTRIPLFWPTIKEPRGWYSVDLTVTGSDGTTWRDGLSLRKRSGPSFAESMGTGAVQLPLEAETFVGSGWSTADYCETYFSGFGANFMSGQRCLSASAEASEGVARRGIDVPQAGRYRVWARYEYPAGYETPFGVRIRQGGRVVFDESYGSSQELKLWPFGAAGSIEDRLQSEIAWPWGGGDNVVWQGHDYDVGLRAGPAEIELYVRDGKKPIADRNVDALLLTTNSQMDPVDPWLPFLAELASMRSVRVRFRNPVSADAPIKLSGDLLLHRNPFVRWPPGIRSLKPLPPGAVSPWIELGPDLDTTDETTLRLQVQSSSRWAGLEVEFEKEAGPEVVRWSGRSGATALVNVPVRYPADGRVSLGEDVVTTLLDTLSSQPFDGRPPSEFLVYPSLWDEGALERYSEEMVSGLLDLYDLLGFNTLAQMVGPADDLSGRRPMPRRVRIRHDRHVGGEKIEEERRSGAADEVRIVSLGDEIPLPRESQFINDENWTSLFINDLEENHPALVESMARVGEIRMASQAEAASHPEMFFHTQRFQGQVFSNLQSRKREAMEAVYGDDVWVGANFSPHNYLEVPARKWVEVFQDGAMTLPWTEDYIWQVPETSVQLVGYLIDALRAGAKTKDLPILFYPMPHSPNNTDRDLRLSAMEAIGHGARALNFFCLFPKQFWFENFVDAGDVSRYRTVGEINHEIGAAEELLLGARPRSAGVALYASSATEIWETAGTGEYGDCEDCDSNLMSEERKGLWLALKHLQVPVDHLTTDDLLAGGLADQSVLFMAADHVVDEAAEVIDAWVRRGGVLFSSIGGGVRNEYDRPSDRLPSILGFETADMVRSTQYVRAKMELPRLAPLGRVEFSSSQTFDVVAARQPLDVRRGTQVVARFEDGTPAATQTRRGRGRSLMTAAPVGLAYVRSAIPVRPWDRGCSNEAMAHLLPTDFDVAARDWIASALDIAGVVAPASTSDPLVEPSVLEGPNGAVVVLCNFTGEPREDLQVQLNLGWTPSSIESVRRGKVEWHSGQEGVCGVRLGVDVTDMLLVRR